MRSALTPTQVKEYATDLNNAMIYGNQSQDMYFAGTELKRGYPISNADKLSILEEATKQLEAKVIITPEHDSMIFNFNRK